MEILDFRIPNNRYSGQRYTKEDYETGLIGSSDCNMYIPFYASFFSETITIKDDVIVEYSLPIIRSISRPPRRYSQLFTNLRTITRPTSHAFKVAGVDQIIGVGRGILYTEDKILMCLAINTDYVLNTSPEEIKTSPDYDKFILYISDDFETPLYKNLKKKIENEYVSSCKELGIDICYTSKINSRLFSNNYVKPSFNSVIELNKHLKEEVPMVIIQ